MSPSENEAREPRRTILIVDDAPMFREIETVFLARSGRVLTANDGTDALLAAHRERPDLVVTDLSMREMHGDELCQRMREDADLRRIPVIVVTGGRSAEEHERAVRAGADDVLEKPLDRVTLLQAVNRVLRQTVRGLVRVPLETDVRLSNGGAQSWAWSRNVSRGGMFVEADAALEPDTELEIEFQIPDSPDILAPTARVVWRRPCTAKDRPGMGLQFLKLDRGAAQWLDQYIYELASAEDLADVASAG